MSWGRAERTASHTPGPWEITIPPYPASDGSSYTEAEIKAREFFIADVSAGLPFPEHLANTRLIAAAPDLLAILRDILDGYQDVLTVDLAVRAAEVIAKATGVQSLTPTPADGARRTAGEGEGQ